jgi:hypothetical protein
MKKETITSKRRPGGVSRSVDYLRSSLASADPDDEAAKPGAIAELSELMIVAINQTARGDAECGYFLAELLAYLHKRSASLSKKNETFRNCFSRWESSRVAITTGSPLRPLIHAILAEAFRERRAQQITKSIPKARLVFQSVTASARATGGDASATNVSATRSGRINIFLN